MPRVIREKILSLLSDHWRQIFDDLYRVRIMRRDKLGYSTVEETATMFWAILQSNEVMVEFSKHKIKHDPFITSIFFCFLIVATIPEPLQEISHINRDIKVLSTKSDRHRGRMNNLK